MKAHDWDYIENQFLNRQYVKMLELIRHIKDSGLSKRLFGAISLDRLIVGNDNPLVWHKETITITFDFQKNIWHFKYYANPFAKPEFERIYPAKKGIEKFDNFIKIIRW